MHKPNRTLLFCVPLVPCVTVLIFILFPLRDAHAAIGGYRTFKGAGYLQTSSAQPTEPIGFSADVDIIFDNPSDFTSAQVTSTSPLSPMTLDIPSPGFTWFPRGYATAADRDLDFPTNATYEFQVSGGSLGTLSAFLSTPPTNLFPSEVPYFTGTTFDRLQDLNVAMPFQFEFNGYIAPAGTNEASIFFGISRVADGQLVYGMSGPNTQTSFVIPANTLEPDTSYIVALDYSSRINAPNAGFSGATSVVGFDLRTDILFMTVPEPSSLALIALGAMGLAARVWYRRLWLHFRHK